MSQWQALYLALWTNGTLAGAKIEEDLFASPYFSRTADLVVGTNREMFGRTFTIPRGRGFDAWMRALKRDGTRRVRLHFVYPTESAIPKYHIGAFKGAGVVPILVAVRTRATSWWGLKNRLVEEIAAPKPPVGQMGKTADIRAVLAVQNERRKKMQAIPRSDDLYITRILNNVIDEPASDFGAARAHLYSTLKDAIAVTSDDPRASFWYERFQQACGRLDGEIEIPTKQPVPWVSERARRLLDAALHAWCFGGMGSLMDRGFADDAEKARYVSLCDSLAPAIDRALCAVVDSV